MSEERRERAVFCWLWCVFLLLECLLASRLPLFVDEAFYWQESRHLAWAYSDLPGLTAWLIRLGTSVADEHLLGVRWPFLALGALLPWLIVLAARELGQKHTWQAGILALLFPLSGLIGVLALPDVPMSVAAAACLIGGARAVRGMDARAALWLAAGLVIGGLSHYRFLAVIGVGFLAILCLPQGRAALRDMRLWLALGVGALAWLPLVLWNLQHGEAGWRFQLVDRHPWALHAEGFRFLLVQAVLATPLLFAAMLQACAKARPNQPPLLRWFALSGSLTLAGFFVLGFFADTERVSFHWPLPGYLALMVLVPAVLALWPQRLRQATWAMLLAASLLGLFGHVLVASPKARAHLAHGALYPENFSGWSQLTEAVRDSLASLPPNTQLLTDNFKTGAQLGFALGNPDIAVLDHPLNHHHGRARQLALWGLLQEGQRPGWQLLVVGESDVKFSARLAHYQSLCQRLGPLPQARIVNVDHGARRFALFALPPESAGPESARDDTSKTCIPPALAHVDTPQRGSAHSGELLMRGWAVKDIVGINRVLVLRNGVPVAEAEYGAANPWVSQFLRGASHDPKLPNVQFEARIPPPAAAGWFQLDLELHSADGNIEPWPGPRVRWE